MKTAISVICILLPVLALAQVNSNTTASSGLSIYFVPQNEVSQTKAFTVNAGNLVTCQSPVINELKNSAADLAGFMELAVGCGNLKARVQQDSVQSMINRMVDRRGPYWPFAVVLFDDRNGIGENLRNDLIQKRYISEGKNEIEPRFVPFYINSSSSVTHIPGGTITSFENQATSESIRNASLNSRYSGFFVVGISWWQDQDMNMYIEDIADALRTESPRFLTPDR